MKDVSRMSRREVVGEIRRLRAVMARIAAGKDGCLSSVYIEIAQRAIDFEEVEDSRNVYEDLAEKF